jgi:hypothetical protein
MVLKIIDQSLHWIEGGMRVRAVLNVLVVNAVAHPLFFA